MPTTTTTVQRKVVTGATMTLTGITLGVLSVPTGVGMSIETDKAACFGDQTYTQVPRILASYDDLTLECLDEGTAITAKVGDVVTPSFTLSYNNGTGTATTKTISKQCSIKAVAYGSASVDGERKSTVTITLAPIGGDDLSTTTTGG